MQKDAMLRQLGYTPNDALLSQLEKIEKNTLGYDKIQKHILDLHDHLKVDNGHVALSNSENYFKVKIEAPTPELAQEAREQVERFANKFKVELKKLDGKDTYYIIGFKH